MNNDTDLQKAWHIIDTMQPGNIYDLVRITPERRQVFIDCVKQRIDVLNDCEFNGDYTKVKRM